MSVTPNFGGDDRGVSELVGFVVVFGIIISSVGVLYMSGFQAMGDYQEHEQRTNAERAMDALAENVNDIVRSDGVRYRAGEITLREGTISTASNQTYIDIDGSPINASGSFSYEHEDTEVVYEGGAVIRSTDAAGWTISEPSMRCSDDVAILSLVDIDGDGTSVTAHGTQEITATQVATDVESITAPTTITVVSDRSDAWNRSLVNSGWEPQGGGEYECGANDGIIRKTTIEISYD